MAKAPEGMVILEVLPHNYDKIIELSEALPPWKERYTEEKLREMRSEAQARNSVALVMFMDPSFWNQGGPTTHPKEG